jgi:hypothetical protein
MLSDAHMRHSLALRGMYTQVHRCICYTAAICLVQAQSDGSAMPLWRTVAWL